MVLASRFALLLVCMGVVLIWMAIHVSDFHKKRNVTPKPLPPSPKDDDSTRNVLNWFEFEPPSKLFNLDTRGNRNTLWDRVLISEKVDRSFYQRQHPQLTVVKPPQLGGSAFAAAMEGVVKFYNIPTLPSAAAAAVRNCHNTTYSLSFDNTAQAACVPPYTRYVTFLREPIAEALAWEVFQVNNKYFKLKAWELCRDNADDETFAMPFPLNFSVLHTTQDLYHALSHNKAQVCRNSALRRNITMQFVAHQLSTVLLQNSAVVGPAISHDWKWMLGTKVTSQSNAKDLLSKLHDKYFAIGLAERFNDLLILLAVHMDWEVSFMYYLTCKPPNARITKQDFRLAFPTLYAQLEHRLRTFSTVYNYVRQDFDAKFTTVLQNSPLVTATRTRYLQGLSDYQTTTQRTPRYAWPRYTYIDGNVETC